MAYDSKPIYVLGTGLSHDGSACLLKDGKIAVAIEKERITRIKHDGKNDTSAIKYCLEAEGINLNQVDLIVQNANYGMFKYGNDWFEGPRLFTNDDVRIVSISHHLAHAYSAIGTSPFNEASVLIIDGCGSSFDECLDLENAITPEYPPSGGEHLYFEKDSYYEFSNGSLRPVYKDFSAFGHAFKQYPMHPTTTQHSIGGMYLSASRYVFRGFDDPGKLMGLAPYGREGIYDFPIFELREGRVFVNYNWMERFKTPCRDSEGFKNNFQYYADIARWVQQEVERAVLYVVKSRREISAKPYLAYTGGVALNALANRRILKESGFEKIYLQPAAGDNGLAIGCAYYGWMEILKKERPRQDGSSFFGQIWSEQNQKTALKKYDALIENRNCEDVCRETATLLAEGKIIGWYQDGSEFGPRALGHRSIICDPRKPDARDFINREIKLREDFRPFAPSVLRQDAHVYFDCDYESPHMLLVADVRSEWIEKIPAVVHKNGTARLQTVTESDGKYFQLIKAFKEISGLSVILNTSFNRKGMPIVETPEEALQFFCESPLDALVIGNNIVTKRPASSRAGVKNSLENSIEEISKAVSLHSAEAKEMGGIYTFEITQQRFLTLDFSAASPRVTFTESDNADLNIEIDEENFLRLCREPKTAAAEVFEDFDRRHTFKIEKIFGWLSST